MSFSIGELVPLPIPFTDLTNRKVRPGLVIGHSRHPEDLFVVPISSVLQNVDSSEQNQQDQQKAKQQAGQPKDKSDKKEQEAAAAQAAGQVTQEQAQQLLDTQKGEEQMLPIKPTGKPGDRTRPIKDSPAQRLVRARTQKANQVKLYESKSTRYWSAT